MDIIPQPKKITYGNSSVFELPDTATLFLKENDGRISKAAKRIFDEVEIRSALSDCYLLSCGSEPEIMNCASDPSRSDYYELHISPDGVRIVSPTAAGLFYGIQSLKQLIGVYGRRLPQTNIFDWATAPLRCDHYDLRTVHPGFSHLKAYMEEMAEFKINYLLIEYEDKLPFQDLKQLRHPHAFTEEELRQLLEAAHDNFIEVIPLQQTFGHLEYVLKHPEFVCLREQPNHVAELCPLKEDSYRLVCQLVHEIAGLHPESHFLHLGGDEVWSIGTCKECKESGLTPASLFIRFINRIAEYAIELGKQPIIWHDMLKDATDEELAALDKRITVAVWIYSGRRMKERIVELVRRLTQNGIRVLGAPSVRCWDDEAAQNYPVVNKRLYNINQWMEAMQEVRLDGLIFTNWSASLALGNPYGLFETTRYLTFWGGELAWNPAADQQSFPKRFLKIYHGITDEACLSSLESPNDYYSMADQWRDACTKRETTFCLLSLISQYEYVMKTGLPIQDLLFRGELFQNNEEVITFLTEKYTENFSLLDQVRPLLRAELEKLLPGHQVELYMSSRFFLPELYREASKKILDIG